MIDVDGSLGEGGGQILRSSIALASVLEKNVRISRIRAGRSRPGIMAQHLAGVKAAAEICGASVEGAQIGSSELTYRPGGVKSGRFRLDVGTAGSVTLVLQTVMPILARALGRVDLELVGGTDVKWSPPVDYLRLVTLPALSMMGYEGLINVFRRGHYPRGGGRIEFRTSSRGGLRALSGLRAGKTTRIEGVSHSVGLPPHVAERQADGARRLIAEKGLPSPGIKVESSTLVADQSPGSGLVLAARTQGGAVLGGDSLGERAKPAQEVGAEGGRRLVEEIESGAFLDRHMGDMVVPYMVLAEGVSEVSVSQFTQHTLTNVKVAELIAGVKFESKGELGAPGILRVKGLGLTVKRDVSSPREVSPSFCL